MLHLHLNLRDVEHRLEKDLLSPKTMNHQLIAPERRGLEAGIVSLRTIARNFEEENMIGESMHEHALLMDVRIMLRMEKCASDMEQRSSARDAAVKDAQSVLTKEECAISTEQ